ncbi:MAG: xanthine dehydrogenase family protein subunit M [Planctomycetes bacterium]|nr:xanthine dehydrogenase family protein subunit M [Planctomycetota bacterium]
MNRFAVARPHTVEQASRLVTDARFSLPVLKGGGMDLVDHMKEGLLEPDLLVELRGLGAVPGGEGIVADGAGVRIDGRVTLAEIAASRIVNERAPVVARAVGSAATPQVRNVATAAGNLLQRPRCWYYRNEQFECLKKGGLACFAADGENKFHAIFGDGPCYIVHPSNLAPALAVCDGVVHLAGGERASIRIADLYHLPAARVRDEHDLRPGEVITHITLAPAPRSGFHAVKEKQSFDWPLVMAAVTLELDGATITSARVCAGAVAPVPWPLPDVERRLSGVRVDDEAAVLDACSTAADGARPLAENAYKLALLPVAVQRAVLDAAGRPVETKR